MDNNDDIRSVLSSLEKFLQQYKELYGNDLFLARETKDIHQHTEKIQQQMKKQTAHSLPQEEELFPTPPSTQFHSPFPDEPWIQATDLETLNTLIRTCTKCSLSGLRKNFVFGVGNPHAEVVVVGEAPGADEDEQGEPFVGRAGQLLNKILEAIHFRREEVFICNVLKCRPPNNRDPLPEEIELCEPYLWKQLEILKPKAILCAGRIAGQALLKTNAPLSQLRGKVHDYRGIPLMVTYHPAALLRNPHWKRPCWEDVQQFRKLYDDLCSGEWKPSENKKMF